MPLVICSEHLVAFNDDHMQCPACLRDGTIDRLESDALSAAERLSLAEEKIRGLEVTNECLNDEIAELQERAS